MKKFTLLSGIAIISGVVAFSPKASAQITINQADLPHAGLNILTELDTTSLPAPGGPSASSQAWDFSTLTKQAPGIVLFMDASATKYASAFPSANLADSTVGITGYNFLSETSSNLSGVGEEEIVNYAGNVFQIEINLNPLLEETSLPATYGSVVAPSTASGSETFAKTFSVVVTGERFTTDISYSDTVDAWGTMKMPNGKTYNVLRQKHHEVDLDSIYLQEFGTWNFFQKVVTYNNEYKWYANGLGYTLVQMNMDSAFTGANSVVWLDTNAVKLGVNDISIENKVSAFPNPANNAITINTNTSGGGDQFISIYDIAGRKLEQVVVKNGVTILNTEAYSSGVYFYNLTDNSGNLIDRGKFIIQH